MFEIMALMNPVQLKESSVKEAMDTPAQKLAYQNMGAVVRDQRRKYRSFQPYRAQQGLTIAKEAGEFDVPKQTVKQQH